MLQRTGCLAHWTQQCAVLCTADGTWVNIVWACRPMHAGAALTCHCLLSTYTAKLADVAFSRQKVHTFFSGSVPVVGTFAWCVLVI